MKYSICVCVSVYVSMNQIKNYVCITELYTMLHVCIVESHKRLHLQNLVAQGLCTPVLRYTSEIKINIHNIMNRTLF